MDPDALQNMFQAHFKLAEKSIKLNEQSPKTRPKRDPTDTMFHWQMNKEHTDDIKSEKNQTRWDTVTGQSHTSKLSITQLKSITLNEMKVPKVHEGRYLVCKTIDDPFSREMELVSVYNNSLDLDDTKWLPKDTILVIKEPYLKYGSQSLDVVLRVNSPSDLIFVDETDLEFLEEIGAKKWHVSETRTAEEIKEAGNKLFRSGDYSSAWKLYDRAIRYHPDLTAPYLNKSMTCLKLGYVHEAYKAAEMALEKGGTREKALFRMGLASYGMRNYQKALEHFQTLRKEFPNNKEVDEHLNKTEARLVESQTGKYNLSEMCLDSQARSCQFDVADYTGPIKIADIPGKGRGIIATEDIKKGTLLIASKAFSVGYNHDFNGKILCTNLIRKRMETMSQKFNLLRTIDNLRKNPQMSSEVYSLYAGNETTSEEIPEGVIDTARIEQICAHNAFGANYECDESLNDGKQKDASMLFLLPSYLNHACIANAYRRFYGDVMFIYAIRDIKEGEEICHSFIHPTKEYAERDRICTNQWGFKCQCCLCQLDRNDPECSKRAELMKEFNKLVDANPEDPAQVVQCGKEMVEKMRLLYKNRQNLRVDLIQMLQVMCTKYADLSDSVRCLQVFDECMKLAGDELRKELRMEATALNVAICFWNVGETVKAREFVCKAMEMSLCADEGHFEAIYPFVKELLN